MKTLPVQTVIFPTGGINLPNASQPSTLSDKYFELGVSTELRLLRVKSRHPEKPIPWYVPFERIESFALIEDVAPKVDEKPAKQQKTAPAA